MRTHKQLNDRRKEMAEACRIRSLDDVCLEFGVAAATVLQACRVHGVQYERRDSTFHENVTIAKTFEILAVLQTNTKTLREIGLRYSLSSARISQIEQLALNAGLLAPRKNQHGGAKTRNKKRGPNHRR